MKAVQIREPGAIELVERAEPSVPRDHVLLRIERVGYCGSDLAAFRGQNPLVTYPRIPGHEIGATVADVGPDVGASMKIGQRCLVMPYANCGSCLACLQHRPNCCLRNKTLGVQTDGAMCEYFAVPAGRILTSDHLTLSQLALVEPLSVGFHAVARGSVVANEAVAVIGCGAIGLGAIIAACAASARVIAIDIDDAKLQTAKQCGAHQVVNSATGQVIDELAELTDGHGPHVVIEAVGSPICYRQAVEAVGAGGRVVYIGWAKQAVEYDTVPFVFKELDIRGSRNALRRDFMNVMDAFSRGLVPDDVLITRSCDVASAPQAMLDWDQNPGRITRIHVNWAEAS